MPSLLFVVLLLSFIASVTAVCSSCHGDAPGCPGTGRDDCPWVKAVGDNATNLASGAAIILSCLVPLKMQRLFPRHFLESISSLFARSLMTVVFDPTGKSVKEVITAVRIGMYPKDEAVAAAAVRAVDLGRDATAADYKKAQAALEAIKAIPVKSLHTSSATEGAMLFILSKLSHGYCDAKKTASSFDLCLDCTDDGAASSSMDGKTFSSTLSRPSNEVAMFRLFNAFVILCQATSLSSCLALCPFLEEVVYEPVHNGTVPWCVAFECVIIYLRMIEAQGGTGGFTIANIVFKAGGIDSIRAQATAIALDHYPSATFRPRGGTPRDIASDDGGAGDKAYKGTIKGYKNTSKVCCAAWNAGKPHLAKNVDANGICNFLHKCNQFVDNKGPNGRCLGDHARHAGCDYASDHKVAKPVSA